MLEKRYKIFYYAGNGRKLIAVFHFKQFPIDRSKRKKKFRNGNLCSLIIHLICSSYLFCFFSSFPYTHSMYNCYHNDWLGWESLEVLYSAVCVLVDISINNAMHAIIYLSMYRYRRINLPTHTAEENVAIEFY